MLPNWLYGKSKSKLASILGGGGGTPEDYNQVKAQVAQNAEDILSKAALTQISNPNLLDNPWFTINQRGFSITSANEYTVDRWRTLGSTGNTTSYTLNSDGTFTIDNTSGGDSAYLIQRAEPDFINNLDGRTITVSVILGTGEILFGTGIYNKTATTVYLNETDFAIESVAQTANQFLVLVVKAGKTVTVKALKLELGSVSTLAMDAPPEYALELAKCQRYFQNILNTDASNNRLIGIAYAVSNTSTRILITLPDHMRTNAPTFTKTGDFVLQPVTGGTAIDVTSVASLGLMETYINIRADVTSGLTAGSVYFLQAKPNAQLIFDADL